ncbi:MAG: nickel pincer cofactor biosynthesis protein LarC, partial [Myxococcales bacterium]|nr:nickel pincer cofactor biosynthesis protein LarC [Myxococcales bacterium]
MSPPHGGGSHRSGHTHGPGAGGESHDHEHHDHEHHDHEHHDHEHHDQDEHHHAHGDGHHHGPVIDGDPERWRDALPRGAGQGKLLLLDTFSGIAGDMTIAALVDLGVPFAVVREAVATLSLSGFELELASVPAGAIGATHFDVKLEAGGRERSYAEIAKLIADSGLRESVKSLAQRIFRILAESEAAVHRIPVESVHFHEVGALDAIVDIVGAAACFDYLGAKVLVTPLPLGRGFVECRHGRIPLPAPATLGCLKGFLTVDSGLEAELVTPTGAAIVAGVAESTGVWPTGKPLAHGWGAGTRKLPDRPNALRAILIAPDGSTDDIELLEANVDDLTGELAGHALAAVLESGAVDAWIVPVTMKKGRPGWVISALAPLGTADDVARCVLRETSSIGVRRRRVARVVRPRREIHVETPWGDVRVKVSEGDFGPAQIKPE